MGKPVAINPMKAELQRIVAAAEAEGQQFVQQARLVFGQHALVQDLEARFSEARIDWERTAHHGGVNLPTIAFLGSLNSGKSWLAQQLLTDPELARRVFPDGVGTRTDRICWAGPERPSGLFAGKEGFVFLRPNQMQDMGVVYQILDTPGVGDVHRESSTLALHALATARLKVLVVREDHLRAEDYQQFIEAADGSIILPVINFCHPSGLDARQQQMQEELLDKLRAVAPQATILQPVCLVDFEKAEGDSGEVASVEGEKFSGSLREVLTNAQAKLGIGAVRQLKISIERFRLARSESISPLLEPLAAPLKDFEDAERQLPEKALDYLLEDESKLRILLRAQLRGLLLENLPQIAFPFRSICGLLIVTAGAWDRLILGAVGSLPSLFLSGAAAVRNIGSTFAAVTPLRDEVKSYLTPLVQQTIREPLENLIRHLPKSETSDTPEGTPGEAGLEITGIEDLVGKWKEETRRAAGRLQIGLGPVRTTYCLATGIFWFLFAAPLVHTYGQYIPAAWNSWRGIWSPEALAAYPAAPSGFWFTALILAVLPVFLLSLLLVSSALSKRRVDRAANFLREAMKSLLQTRQIPFSVHVRNPRITALRFLSSANRKSPP